MLMATENHDSATPEQPSLTLSTKDYTVTTNKHELKNTEEIPLNTKTSDQMRTEQQADTHKRQTTTAQTFKMPLTSDPSTQNSEILHPKQTTAKAVTSQQKVTSEEVGSTTKSPEETVPITWPSDPKSSFSATTKPETVTPVTWSSDSTPSIGKSQSTTVVSGTRSPGLYDHSFSTFEYSSETPVSSVTPSHLARDLEYSTTPNLLEKSSRRSYSDSEILQHTTDLNDHTSTFEYQPEMPASSSTPGHLTKDAKYSTAKSTLEKASSRSETDQYTTNLNDHSSSTYEYSYNLPASSAVPSHLTNNVEYSTTPSPSGEASRKSSSASTTVQHATTSSPWSAAINCSSSTEYNSVSHENQGNSSQLTTGGWSQSGGPFRGDTNTTDCMTTHPLEKHTITLVQGPSMPSIDCKLII